MSARHWDILGEVLDQRTSDQRESGQKPPTEMFLATAAMVEGQGAVQARWSVQYCVESDSVLRVLSMTQLTLCGFGARTICTLGVHLRPSLGNSLEKLACGKI